jgi:hypothetical protein
MAEATRNMGEVMRRESGGCGDRQPAEWGHDPARGQGRSRDGRQRRVKEVWPNPALQRTAALVSCFRVGSPGGPRPLSWLFGEGGLHAG